MQIQIRCYRINTNNLWQTLIMYLFMVDLTTLSVSETIQRRMEG